MPSRVLVVRGHQANPWELRPWELLDPERYAVEYLATGSGWFETGGVGLPRRDVRALRDALPAGRLGDLAARVPGDRYLEPLEAFRGADIVHAQELGYWYSMQAARAKRRLGFKLALTVWETLPFRAAYRNVRTRRYREQVLAATDLFLPATERAAACLRLEGADPARIRVLPPGIDAERFAVPRADPAGPPHVLSPGRLVWEKGHQDVLRAVAALRTGVVDGPRDVRVTIVGRGPEEDRLRAYVRDLGIEDAVTLRSFVPYEEMPGLYAQATVMVLASLPTTYWEEQFGMVLAEAMAASLPIVASTSGAIPEVVGEPARFFAPGDWLGVAHALADPPPPPDGPRYTAQATAAGLATAYDSLLP